ncbi:hypothetical protein PROSTU_00741 [Providencia stuartii ATCC 25827]|uniref:Uncharacterized protein n=1 Tax=Providencia stuartii ATCC 25827 TaxID=471874 RepID=A0AA86YVW4_PROST|nr:hypothetical protein PROSTU_00741 [Providencia stuartii ATCC 25827]
MGVALRFIVRKLLVWSSDGVMVWRCVFILLADVCCVAYELSA